MFVLFLFFIVDHIVLVTCNIIVVNCLWNHQFHIDENKENIIITRLIAYLN